MPLQIIKSEQHLWWGGPGRRLRQVTKAKRSAWQCSDSILEKKQKVLVATRMDIFLLHLFASVRLEAEIASQWIHHFNVCHFGRFNPHSWSETPMFFPFVVSNSCCRRRPEHHRGFGQHGQSQPKACWTMELTIPSMDGRWKIWVKPLTSWQLQRFFALLE